MTGDNFFFDATAYNPLYMLLNEKSWDSVLKQLKTSPWLAQGTVKLAGFYDGNKKIKSNVNALHIACKHNAPVEVIEALIKADPTSVLQEDSTFQRLPLHVATLNQSSPKLIGVLLKASHQSSKVQDANGRLAIHFACKDPINGERSLRHLLKVYPESTNVADDQGFLPIHVACRSGMPMAVVSMLLRVAPESILAKSNKGATPVHCARNVKGKGAVQENVVELLRNVAIATKGVVDAEGLASITGDENTIFSGKSGGSTIRSGHGLLRSMNVSKKVPTGICILTSSVDVPGAVDISDGSSAHSDVSI